MLQNVLSVLIVESSYSHVDGCPRSGSATEALSNAAGIVGSGIGDTVFFVKKLRHTSYAAKQNISDIAALKQGMEFKAIEFVKSGAELYRKQ